VMDFEHHQVHEGETYHFVHFIAALGTGTNKVAFTVPVFSPAIQGPHLVIDASVYNGTTLIYLYEGSTFTGGSALTPLNRNRNSANAARCTAKAGVTSTDGTLLDMFYFGSGGRSASNGERQAVEWVLKSNTVYRIDLIGQIAGTAIALRCNWYEDLGV